MPRDPDPDKRGWKEVSFQGSRSEGHQAAVLNSFQIQSSSAEIIDALANDIHG